MSSPQLATRFRWVIVGLLFLITITNYIDRASIAYAIAPMAKTFGFNATQIGTILGSFGLGYMVTTFFSGVVVDKLGARRLMTIAVILWSVFISMTGLAMGFMGIILARIGLGVSEGPNFPSMTRATADWLTRAERASALSYALIAVPIALAMGGPLVTQLINHVNWRGMFFILAGLALVWSPLWWWLFRDAPSDSKFVNRFELERITQQQEPVKHIPHPWQRLLRNPTLIANYWAFFVFGYYLFFFMSWLPLFLHQRYHLSLTQVGLFSVLPWSMSAIMMFFGGKLSDGLLKKTNCLRISRSYLIAGSQALAALFTLPIAYAANPLSAIFFISLAVSFCMSTNAAYYAVNIDVYKERSATALGIMDAAFALAGFLAPVITGFLVQRSGDFIVAFVLLAGLALSSVIGVLLFHNPDKA